MSEEQDKVYYLWDQFEYDIERSTWSKVSDTFDALQYDRPVCLITPGELKELREKAAAYDKINNRERALAEGKKHFAGQLNYLKEKGD